MLRNFQRWLTSNIEYDFRSAVVALVVTLVAGSLSTYFEGFRNTLVQWLNKPTPIGATIILGLLLFLHISLSRPRPPKKKLAAPLTDVAMSILQLISHNSDTYPE